MPKTYSNLYPKIITWENLYFAYSLAAKGKRYRNDALLFRDRLEENLAGLQDHLTWESWRPSPYKAFTVYEPKERLIMAPSFPDRVAHHALVNVISPLLEKKFIFDSYACRNGKGMHASAHRVQDFLRAAKRKWGRVYVLKADISRYFPSVSAAVLSGIISRTIRDRKVLSLCRMIIDHGSEAGRGMPVGSLTSQLWANIYMDQLDHIAKERESIQYYVRYMDDWVVIGPTKAWLWEKLETLTGFLSDTLRLKLNPKTGIFPASHGVDFCGYRIWDTHILPRKRNVRRAKERFRRLNRAHRAGRVSRTRVLSSVASFIGYMKHCSGDMSARSALQYAAIG